MYKGEWDWFDHERWQCWVFHCGNILFYFFVFYSGKICCFVFFFFLYFITKISISYLWFIPEVKLIEIICRIAYSFSH